jgi:hypothetical protein
MRKKCLELLFTQINRIPKKKEETQMRLKRDDSFGAGSGIRLRLELELVLTVCLLLMALAKFAGAQTITTTTVQGTVYLANGQPASGTLVVSWPAFTTASGQSVTADSTTVAIATNGTVSMNLAPNQGATPAGLYYTAVFYVSDGTAATQYSEFSTALFINLPLGS